MRAWIGTGVSLLGCVVVVIALVKVIRWKANRPAGPSRSSPDGRRQVQHRTSVGDSESRPGARDMVAHRMLFSLCGGLLVMECGQLIRADTWLWALLHAVTIGIVAVGTALLYRDGRRARRNR